MCHREVGGQEQLRCRRLQVCKGPILDLHVHRLLTAVVVLAAMDCSILLKQRGRGCGSVTAFRHVDNCVHDRQVLADHINLGLQGGDVNGTLIIVVLEFLLSLWDLLLKVLNLCVGAHEFRSACCVHGICVGDVLTSGLHLLSHGRVVDLAPFHLCIQVHLGLSDHVAQHLLCCSNTSTIAGWILSGHLLLATEVFPGVLDASAGMVLHTISKGLLNQGCEILWSTMAKAEHLQRSWHGHVLHATVNLSLHVG
mmetsp:Transcript_30456/g.66973  ORF Transcript_30456/g.66973 Transcript_30456/m.66973 type:complete len:253 (-) Transcript_30456:113-871(-)